MGSSSICAVGRADVVCFGEHGTAGRSTEQVHLFLDRHAKDLHDVKPVDDLFRLAVLLVERLGRRDRSDPYS